MDMKIFFPENKKVNAEFSGFSHFTDQPVSAGGQGSAPTPFDLFLASMGTCAGIYVLGFCQKRDLDTKNIELQQSFEWDPHSHMLKKVNLTIKLPPDFPKKYHRALVQAAGLCSVKKHLEKPPEFSIEAVVAENRADIEDFKL